MTPQTAILPAASSHALFLLLRRRLGRRIDGQLAKYIAGFHSQLMEFNKSQPDTPVLAAIGIGAECWAELFGRERPAELRAFPHIAGAIHPAPITNADLIVHLRGEQADLLHDVASDFLDAVRDWLEPVEVTAAFRRREGRDLTGFVDGTENPEDDERATVALVSEQDPDWAAGSYLHIQRYVHRMESWNKLPVLQQEAIIGRTKHSDEELPDDDRPRTAHISRVVIEDENGEELALLRQSLPYGTPGGDRGLYFASYCHTPRHFEKMLTRMVAPTDDGRVDHLLNFSRAVTGAAFFVPSIEKLTSLAKTDQPA
ncbi:Dyp-type peroxidase [Chitinilyticum piscinae]|uniref:Dyp-type peroxidase n=1 Tax=Chitinilyticum piscinae TaxID=2866724 RepID=A0A8J7FKR3_9NEIS|nr:Dyp-type peroxidase [Chitinilyticum piscinae]MBE9607936.1 Dyp-type peroxidase [Chitinilyticum piscinae]